MENEQLTYVQGQRWVSDAEPELGLGIILEADAKSIRLVFPASEVERGYSRQFAPIRRARFTKGDTIRDREGRKFFVTDVEEEDGLLFYHSKERIVSEIELSDRIGMDDPKERIQSGRWDQPEDFDLRRQALELRHEIAGSPVRGLLGGRVDLYGHQMYIASEVSRRHAPKVLLSDETGLGKTIEACLIMHRLVLSGRVSRVFVAVPESLVHQWFVEMYRRFNLVFRIADEQHCKAVEKGAPAQNPFLDDQLVLASLDFLSANKRRASQALEAGWDMIVIDEAHRIKEKSNLYRLLSDLGRRTRRMLLLSATPEQLGRRNHFARLKLLDPARFYDYNEFLNESERYGQIAALAGRILDGNAALDEAAKQVELLAPGLIDDDFSIGPSKEEKQRRRLIDRLIDHCGTGRAIFRNTRSVVKNFAERKASLIPLPGEDVSDAYLETLSETFLAESENRALSGALDFGDDKRIDWLADFIRGLENEKALLICRGIQKVLAVEKALAQRINRKVAVFHEGLSMLQRDRNAAWFSDPDGAVLLISSEIGSEGRNFQFARHLVLIDLPLDPEQLEQRIGRLDRIGQKSDIMIHVPFIETSPQEVLARWYHEGLGQFESCIAGGLDIYEAFGARVRDLAVGFHRMEKADAKTRLGLLIQETAAFREDLAKKLAEGRDRLLELSSYRPEKVASLLEQIQEADRDAGLERFMEKAFDRFGVEMDRIADRIHVARPGDDFDESFPLPDLEGTGLTFDRQTAVNREDLAFVTQDHPMVAAALDIILGGQRGNCTVCASDGPSPGLVLDAVFVLECLCPKRLYPDRFLPPTIVRVALDHEMRQLAQDDLNSHRISEIESAEEIDEAARKVLLRSFFPEMLKQAEKIAKTKAEKIVKEAVNRMLSDANEELGRLQRLQKSNPLISDEEIQSARNEARSLASALEESYPRLDCVRLIVRGLG